MILCDGNTRGHSSAAVPDADNVYAWHPCVPRAIFFFFIVKISTALHSSPLQAEEQRTIEARIHAEQEELMQQVKERNAREMSAAAAAEASAAADAVDAVDDNAGGAGVDIGLSSDAGAAGGGGGDMDGGSATGAGAGEEGTMLS